MANKQRYRRGPQKLVKGLIDAGVKAQVGDLVALVSNYVTPASLSGLTTVAGFKAAFLGVLVEGATSGEETSDTPCLVATEGVFEFDLASALGAALHVGKTIGPVAVSSVVQDQTVAGVADRDSAIALLAEEAPVGATTLLIEIFSELMGNPLYVPA